MKSDLAEHKKTCVAKPGNCPYEKKLQKQIAESEKQDNSDKIDNQESGEYQQIKRTKTYNHEIGKAIEDACEKVIELDDFPEWDFDPDGDAYDFDFEEYDIDGTHFMDVHIPLSDKMLEDIEEERIDFDGMCDSIKPPDGWELDDDEVFYGKGKEKPCFEIQFRKKDGDRPHGQRDAESGKHRKMYPYVKNGEPSSAMKDFVDRHHKEW